MKKKGRVLTDKEMEQKLEKFLKRLETPKIKGVFQRLKNK